MHFSEIAKRSGGLRAVLLIVYTFFILFSSAILQVQNAQYLPKWFLLTAVLCALLCPPLLRFTRQLTIISPSQDHRRDRKWAFLFFVIPLICFLSKFIIYYPGGFVSDSIDQYGQAVTGQYNNWHPAIHTLLFFTVPLKLSNGWKGSIILYQIVLFSLTLCYSFTTLRRIAGNRFTLISLAFVLLNPETGNIAVMPVKDTAFGICALLLIAFTLRIFFSSGEWIRSPFHLIVFAFVLGLTALIRHNGILFVLPLLVALFFLIPLKRIFALITCCAVFFCGIRFPLYSGLHVSPPGDQAFETLGLPLTIILSCAKSAPDSLDDETENFVRALLPEDVFNSTDSFRDFNSVKYKQSTNIPLIGQYGAGRILSMAARCFVHSPLAAFKSLIGVTHVVYTLTDDYNYCDYPRTRSAQYGLLMQGIPKLQNICDKLSGVLNLTFPWLFMYVGAMHYLLIALILAKCGFRKKKDRAKILVVLSVFVYNYGTALLLSGVSDSSRYFIYTFWLTPFLTAFFLQDTKKKQESV